VKRHGIINFPIIRTPVVSFPIPFLMGFCSFWLPVSLLPSTCPISCIFFFAFFRLTLFTFCVPRMFVFGPPYSFTIRLISRPPYPIFRKRRTFSLCSPHSPRSASFLSDRIIPPCLPIFAHARPTLSDPYVPLCTSTHCPFSLIGLSMLKDIFVFGKRVRNTLTGSSA
jgi:hypothetical protein